MPFIDSTAANTIEAIARKAERHGVLTFASGATEATQRLLERHGAKAPRVRFEPNLEAAIAKAHAEVREQP